MSFFKRIFSGKKKESLDSGLEKTRTNVFQRLAKVFTGRRKVDEELMDDLEEALITADVGVDTANKILDRLRKRARFEAYMEVQELYEMLREDGATANAKVDAAQDLLEMSWACDFTLVLAQLALLLPAAAPYCKPGRTYE